MTAEPFLWGAATSAHQTEGNNVASDVWALENRPDGPFAERSGDACDSYHRWREDLDIVAELGLNAYRFSIEWARIEPVPGEVSRAELAHYRRMIEGCLDRGLTPMVTLHHFSLPAWLRAAGGWTGEGAVERFRAYVAAVLPILDGVRWVCTVNEPNMLAIVSAAMRSGAQHPGAPVVAAPDPAVTEALTRAHQAAREVLGAVPGLRSGWTVAMQNTQPVDDRPESRAAAERWGWECEDRYLDVARDDDFVGVQAYTRLRVGPDGPVPVPEDVRRTITGWEYYPAALEEALRRAAGRVGPAVALVVTENGIATGDDAERVEYTAEALRGLAAARRDGLDVRGYFHWSLLDNYEWGHWGPTFGLVGVDRATFARTVKPSARWYGDVARSDGAVLG